MDFTIKTKEELIIGLAEAKRDNLNNGVEQIAVQLQASLQHSRRKRGCTPDGVDVWYYGEGKPKY
ncbi:hypothetical protein BC937DRAFT_94700 [Endogone sp. FLAS-F59071]|nr:hypothetical protein BC937DRAFT_94700 [Endogone sp. FLAS-F59071]|eukprot:RUS20647.1 hypothetical protein BC937DRAFT_94700 [Endogone sp. FLAS-F59071]